TERAEAFFPLFDCSLPLAADRAGRPPTLSSLPDKSASARSSAAQRRAIRCERRRTRRIQKRDARAASQKECRVTELMPEIALGNGRVVRALGEFWTGHGFDEQEVRCLRIVPSGDQPVDDAYPSLRRDHQIGPS